MHRVFMILLILLLSACSLDHDGLNGSDENDTSESVNVDIGDIIADGSGHDTAMSDPITVESSTQNISITGLEGGRLYIIYTNKNVTENSRKTSSPTAQINSLGDGRYTLFVPAGCTECALIASDIGLSAGGEFRIGKASDIAFQEGSIGMSIGEEIDDPVFIDADGTEYYEAFYSVDIETIPNPSRVVVTEVISHTGGAGGSHSFSFIDESGKTISTISKKAILDLSGYDTVYLWQRLWVDYSENGDQLSTLYLLSPQIIGSTGTISNPGTYIIEASPVDQYLIVDGLADSNGGLGVFVNDVNARYADDGRSFPGVFPIAVTESGVVLNIPRHDKDIMFDYDGMTSNVRLVVSDGSYKTDVMGKGTKTFNVPEGSYVYPILAENIPAGASIRMTTDSENLRLRIGLCNSDMSDNGIGTVENGKSYDMRGSMPLYFFLLNGSREACSFTLTVE